jgi:hypothetical protein
MEVLHESNKRKEPFMALTLASLVDSVNLEMQNHERRGSATAIGDGDSRAFIVAPMGGYITEDAVWTAAIDGAGTDQYVMDYTTGVCTFTIAPDLDAEVSFVFNYTPYHPTVVEDAITAAASAIFPWFYDSASQDISLDGTSNEYELDDCEEVTSVMTAVSGSSNYVRIPRKKYEILSVDGVKTLRFFTTPGAGTARVLEITRPLITTLPDRAKSALVSYACYYLITTRMAPRVRTDIAVATQGTGTLSPRQMNDAATSLYLRMQMQLQQVRQRPWSTF